MERHGEEVDLTPTEARGGSTPHIVRYVLIISIVLAIVVLSIVWMTGAATTESADTVTPVTNQATPEPTLDTMDAQPAPAAAE